MKISKKIISAALCAAMAVTMCAAPAYADEAAQGNGSAGISFNDVAGGAYYYDAVNWAVSAGITTGTSSSTFSPDAGCTRAQMVTLMYKAMAPSDYEPSTLSDFTDVSADAYYFDAVNWAVDSGIATGMSSDVFGASQPCTRAQAVSFLARTAKLYGIDFSGAGSFTDVSADSYYADSVKWAVKEGITEGTGNQSFSPDLSCTRGQIITFLYRWQNLQNKSEALIQANDLKGTLLKKYDNVSYIETYYKKGGVVDYTQNVYKDNDTAAYESSQDGFLVGKSDGTFYGKYVGEETPYKIVFGDEKIKEAYLQSYWQLADISMLDSCILKDYEQNGSNAVYRFETGNSDYLQLAAGQLGIESGSGSVMDLIVTADRDSNEISNMTEIIYTADGSASKTYSADIKSGGAEKYVAPEKWTSMLFSNDVRHLTWTFDAGTASERTVTDSVGKGCYFACVSYDDLETFTDSECTVKTGTAPKDYNADTMIYSKTGLIAG